MENNVLTCSICRETFKTPKVLPCGHTFCLGCLNKVISGKRTFSCPYCKTDVKISFGGAEEFITNYQVQTNEPRDQSESSSITLSKCPHHDQKEVGLYCKNCNVGLCSECKLEDQHRGHQTLDLKCEETRKKAIETFQCSRKIIHNRIKNLEKNHAIILKSLEQLKFLCEDSCSLVTDEQIITDLKNNLEENRTKMEDRTKKIRSAIDALENDTELNISSSNDTTLDILLTLPRLKEKEKFDGDRQMIALSIQFLKWETDLSSDRHKLGSVISKPFYIPGSYQFLFDVNEIEKLLYGEVKFRNNHTIWPLSVNVRDNDLIITIGPLQVDNPGLDYITIDYQLNLFNINDDSKTLAETCYNIEFNKTGLCKSWKPITWSELTDRNNGFITSSGQFMIQWDITLTKVIKFSE